MWVMESKPLSQSFSEQSWETDEGCGYLMAMRNCNGHQLLD